MDDSMVTARMPRSKKDAGARALGELGYTASQAINELYDYLLKTGNLPFRENRERTVPDKKRMAEAFAYIDSIAIVEPSEFDLLDEDELMKRRLIEKGIASEEDFV